MVKIGDLTQAQANSMKFPKLLTDSPSYTPPGLSTRLLDHLHRALGALPHDAGLRAS